MFRRTANTNNVQARSRVNSRIRSRRAKVVGFVLLTFAALMLVAGAYRRKADLIWSGLTALAAGAVLTQGVFRNSWIFEAVFCAFAMVGVFYALTTWIPLPWSSKNVIERIEGKSASLGTRGIGRNCCPDWFGFPRPGAASKY